MSRPVAFDYALVRAVPRVHVGDGETVAVVLQSRQAGFLDVRLAPDLEGLAARWPGLDAALLTRYLAAQCRLARGDPSALPLARLPPSERFHWLVAPRSTVLQPTPVRTGLTPDPRAQLDRIAADVFGPR